MIRQRTCDRCDLHYAVFGEHRFCPSCGMLSPLRIAEEALNAEEVRLNALSDLPENTLAELREAGVLDRTFVDTVKNIVSIVETLAERVFRNAAENPEASLRGKGKVFQRLDDFADLYMSELGVDIREPLGPTWDRLLVTWAARHVYTHNDGIIDEKIGNPNCWQLSASTQCFKRAPIGPMGSSARGATRLKGIPLPLSEPVAHPPPGQPPALGFSHRWSHRSSPPPKRFPAPRWGRWWLDASGPGPFGPIAATCPSLKGHLEWVEALDRALRTNGTPRPRVVPHPTLRESSVRMDWRRSERRRLDHGWSKTEYSLMSTRLPSRADSTQTISVPTWEFVTS